MSAEYQQLDHRIRQLEAELRRVKETAEEALKRAKRAEHAARS